MPIATEQEVRSILNADQEMKIAQAYRLAWKDWWNSPDRQRLSRWPRTRANNIFEYLVRRLESAFIHDPETLFRFERETFKLIVQCRLIIRFKKSNNNGVGSNISTQAELAYCDMQTDLPGLQGLLKAEIVYGLNVTHTDIAQITVLARNGDRRLWSYNIMGSSGAIVSPLVQSQSPVPDIGRMIVPKMVDKLAEESDM